MTKKCLNYQRNKFLKHKLYKKLQPIKTLSGLWKVILWNFIIKLLKSKDPVTEQLHDVILVIVNRLTKWGYFIAYTEEILAEDVAQIYIKEVFSWHRSLDKIILNRDLKFITAFWEIFLAEQRV